MTNNEILNADLLDILFEHRNKSYGAYALRRYYNSRLLKALIIALSVVLLFFAAASFFNRNNRQKSDRGNDTGRILTITDIKTKPPKDPDKPQPPAKPVPSSQVKDLPIKIVPDDKADVIPDQTEIAVSAISDTTIDGVPPLDLSKGATGGAETGAPVRGDHLPDQTIDPVEIQPSFPGGPEALALFFSRNLSSPTDLEAGEKKVILVRFVVGADGSITKAEIIQSGGEEYDREVLRAFKRMPRWNPAMQNGIRVSATFTQPVTFIGVE
jgi:protein TonB